MDSIDGLYIRANHISDMNKRDGRVIDEDIWMSMILIYGELKAIRDTMAQLIKDGFSTTRSSTITLLDRTMEELDEKLSMLETKITELSVPA